MAWLVRNVCAVIARILGWTFEGNIPEDLDKCVIIVAPHTSAWDFIIGMAALVHYDFEISYFAKEELFKWPFAGIFRSTGGIPIDRFQANDIVDHTVSYFQKKKRLRLALSPEGTRARTEKWRTGFYQIASKAKVPIVLGAIDFSKRKTFISAPYRLTGNKEKDYKVITEFFEPITAHTPKNWNPTIK